MSLAILQSRYFLATTVGSDDGAPFQPATHVMNATDIFMKRSFARSAHNAKPLEKDARRRAH